MAGASFAAEISPAKSVLLLEAEAQPGYHATGRSVAFWTESYGGPVIQPLTTASGDFLRSPPAEFFGRPFLQKRGALHIGSLGQEDLAEALVSEFADSPPRFERFEKAAMDERIAGLRSEWSIGLWEGGCSDIDVAALHAAYLRKARKNGAKLKCSTSLQQARFVGNRWEIQTSGGRFSAKMLVNGAGAWADSVAENSGVSGLGIQPFRRTVLQITTSPAALPDQPLVIALDGSFYFKPEPSGALWLSPHDESPSDPCDAAPEEIDIALAIDRFEKVIECKALKLEHKWAGLRSFAPDRLPVIGRDPASPQFFWLAGQGGFGIQTAPAIAQLAASMIQDGVKPPPGVDGSSFLPDRFK